MLHILKLSCLKATPTFKTKFIQLILHEITILTFWHLNSESYIPIVRLMKQYYHRKHITF